MINKLKQMIGLGTSADYSQLLKQGAIIVDVRSKSEFSSGHIKGSINIPVNEIGKHMHKFKDKNQPIITCCASGMRSSSAKSFLRSNGYTQVHNGGGWHSLQHKI